MNTAAPSATLSLRKMLRQRIAGLNGAAKAWYLAQTIQQDCSKILLVCKDKTESEKFLADLRFFLKDSAIPTLSFPAWDTLPFESVSPQSDITALRLATLRALATLDRFIVVTEVRALMQYLPFYKTWMEGTLGFHVEDTVSRQSVLQNLDYFGFRHVAVVETVGEMAVRGSVVDVFYHPEKPPVRIEFSGDTIVALREFDVESQRSTGTLPTLSLGVIRETIFSAYKAARAQQVPRIRDILKKRAAEVEAQPREMQRFFDALEMGSDTPGIELLNAIAFDNEELPCQLFDILPPATHIVIDDDANVTREIDYFADSIEERTQRLSHEHHFVPPVERVYVPREKMHGELKKRVTLVLTALDLLGEEESPVQKIRSFTHAALSTALQANIGTGKNLHPLRAAIEAWRSSGLAVAFTVGSVQRAERLHAILLKLGLHAEIKDFSGTGWLAQRDRFPLVILLGQISAGFSLPDEHFVFISETEVFTDRSQKKATKAHRSLKRYLAALAKLQENDFIVHIDYGIGCYRGLKHLIVEGTGHDFLQLEYAGDSTLYLPVENIGRIQKFVAEEGKVPKLDKLGSTRWARAKAKVKHSLVTLAGDLIKLYAARQEGKGWRFEPYGAEDERFADGFGYTETIDQQAAITETLQDMAIERPMDRLICGDAGYGKTEVALRASFKCAQHARQVAILVPTTLLVEQHYKVFAERFLGYPVRVGAISRLHTSEANKATLAALASGEIDIIIGTHALLQPRVHFRDLGLVIIDEEHRFGVKHKERLKQIRKNVDVLTLTATPIPRTLHMALLGIRDISIITTPPTDRRSVRTYVAPHSENLIRDAILRELQRGGQCFYLHNKVANIATVTHQLRQLVPEARFVFGHGQMNERELERVMLQFIDKKADVLVSTTIIESGIDIPNANTIIVNRADQFGLAQLYQIRGRVGRSDRQAYAYLLVPEAAKLGSQAQQRLIVLQTLDELGAGFTLATRDLEIRGAGNLLGKDQSGFVQTVGLDLYNRILKEAILNLRGEELDIAEITDPELKLGIDAYIPETYIPDVTERLILYQRLSNLRDSLETDDLVAEIEDRFGHATEEVYNLIELMRLRALLRQHGIVQAELGVHRILFTFSAARPVPLDKIRAACKRKPKEFRISSNNTVSCAVRYESHEDPKLLYREVRGILGVLV